MDADRSFEIPEMAQVIREHMERERVRMTQQTMQAMLLGRNEPIPVSGLDRKLHPELVRQAGLPDPAEAERQAIEAGLHKAEEERFAVYLVPYPPPARLDWGWIAQAEQSLLGEQQRHNRDYEHEAVLAPAATVRRRREMDAFQAVCLTIASAAIVTIVVTLAVAWIYGGQR